MTDEELKALVASLDDTFSVTVPQNFVAKAF
jgi:hypothetical protein